MLAQEHMTFSDCLIKEINLSIYLKGQTSILATLYGIQRY